MTNHELLHLIYFLWVLEPRRYKIFSAENVRWLCTWTNEGFQFKCPEVLYCWVWFVHWFLFLPLAAIISSFLNMSRLEYEKRMEDYWSFRFTHQKYCLFLYGILQIDGVCMYRFKFDESSSSWVKHRRHFLLSSYSGLGHCSIEDRCQ